MKTHSEVGLEAPTCFEAGRVHCGLTVSGQKPPFFATGYGFKARIDRTGAIIDPTMSRIDAPA
jgi:hypothetical protein